MKYVYLLVCLAALSSCSTTKNTTKSNPEMSQMSKQNTCPSDGVCDLVLHKNKKLEILKDEFGMLYPEISEGENYVLEYTYTVKGPEGTADGNYSETIQFEIPAINEPLTYKDNALEKTKLLWGKHSFVRGEAGYHQVYDGNLQLKKVENELIVDLDFAVEGATQKISEIHHRLKL